MLMRVQRVVLKQKSKIFFSFNSTIRSKIYFYLLNRKNTLYDVLGLESNCTQEEIKRAYRKVSMNEIKKDSIKAIY